MLFFIPYIAPFLNAAQLKHIGQLSIFFIFHVLILTLDIYSDFATAVDLLFKGHLGWGLSTLLPIFAPMIVRIGWTLFNQSRAYWKKAIPRIEVQLKDLPNIIWHIPFLQPVRYLHFICLFDRDLTVEI